LVAEESAVRLQEREVRARQHVLVDDLDQRCVTLSSDSQSFVDTERIARAPFTVSDHFHALSI
jgi:hypothetical protein